MIFNDPREVPDQGTDFGRSIGRPMALDQMYWAMTSRDNPWHS